MKLIGPFTEIITLSGIPDKGGIKDEALQVIKQGGVLLDDQGYILQVEVFEHLSKGQDLEIEWIEGQQVLLPGFIDCHTHLCFEGSRARDYALRVSGKTYLEIAQAGGGIWDTVQHTRSADPDHLLQGSLARVRAHAKRGITTIEVKSGYGLETRAELTLLRCIRAMQEQTPIDLIPTCLAAHMKPKDFKGSETAYLEHIIKDLLPKVKAENLAGRVDIFIETSAFTVDQGKAFLKRARASGFDLTVHADQFTPGGSMLAIQQGAVSADHLEASASKEIQALGQAGTVAVALPGASIGLGMSFAPARALLDAGACVAIASDWNPGSAPMGDLLTQACILGTFEKLSIAETLSGLCFRAAKALNLRDRGRLISGMLGDMQAYPCADYREIFYHQGQLKPTMVWKNGKILM